MVTKIKKRKRALNSNVKAMAMYISKDLDKPLTQLLQDENLNYSTTCRNLWKMFINFPPGFQAKFIENNVREFLATYKRGKIGKTVHFSNEDYEMIPVYISQFRVKHKLKINFVIFMICLLIFFVDMTKEERKRFIEEHYMQDPVNTGRIL